MPRGPLQQHRLAAATAFRCFRCGSAKTSKLITRLQGAWDCLLCNGCYGRLLALYEVKSGDGPVEERAAALAQHLEGLVSSDERRRAAELRVLRDRRMDLLDGRTVRLLATADYVATQLVHTTGLDWSAAVIGICKAVEVEVIRRLIQPLAAACAGVDLSQDVADKDLGRVARYCAGRTESPPELGAIRHALSTASLSIRRRSSSPLLTVLNDVVAPWPAADWLFARGGALDALATLTVRHRNRAAHTDELTAEDYQACVDLALSPAGLLWRLVRATTARR